MQTHEIKVILDICATKSTLNQTHNTENRREVSRER